MQKAGVYGLDGTTVKWVCDAKWLQDANGGQTKKRWHTTRQPYAIFLIKNLDNDTEEQDNIFC